MSVRSLFLRVHLLSRRSLGYLDITHFPHALLVYLHSRYEKPWSAYQAGVWSYRHGESSRLLGVPNPRFLTKLRVSGEGLGTRLHKVPSPTEHIPVARILSRYQAT